MDETSFSEQELERFGQMCRVFVHELVPFLNRCLQILFPQAQLATILGVPVSDLAKVRNGVYPINDMMLKGKWYMNRCQSTSGRRHHHHQYRGCRGILGASL